MSRLEWRLLLVELTSGKVHTKLVQPTRPNTNSYTFFLKTSQNDARTLFLAHQL